MTDYSALISAWNLSSATPGALPHGVVGTSLHGLSTAAKIEAVNGWTVHGPLQDVDATEVLGYLALAGKLAQLQTYAKTPPATSAGVAASEFFALLSTPSFSVFRTSLPAVYSGVSTWLNDWAQDPATGVTTGDVAAILDMAATTTPWWQVSSLSGPISDPDLQNAGGLT